MLIASAFTKVVVPVTTKSITAKILIPSRVLIMVGPLAFLFGFANILFHLSLKFRVIGPDNLIQTGSKVDCVDKDPIKKCEDLTLRRIQPESISKHTHDYRGEKDDKDC